MEPCGLSVFKFLLLSVVLVASVIATDSSHTKTKRQIFREQVLPLAGGKIPSGAFRSDRLALNRLNKEGIAVPDGVLLEARHRESHHGSHRNDPDIQDSIVKLIQRPDGRYAPPEGRYPFNNIVESTYIIRPPINTPIIALPPLKPHISNLRLPAKPFFAEDEPPSFNHIDQPLTSIEVFNGLQADFSPSGASPLWASFGSLFDDFPNRILRQAQHPPMINMHAVFPLPPPSPPPNQLMQDPPPFRPFPVHPRSQIADSPRQEPKHQFTFNIQHASPINNQFQEQQGHFNQEQQSNVQEQQAQYPSLTYDEFLPPPPTPVDESSFPEPQRAPSQESFTQDIPPQQDQSTDLRPPPQSPQPFPQDQFQGQPDQRHQDPQNDRYQLLPENQDSRQGEPPPQLNQLAPQEEVPSFKLIPRTPFVCTTEMQYTMQPDPYASCQVFHLCHPSGEKESFLCPQGSRFDHTNHQCTSWKDVPCSIPR